jgi:CelD/BcsL family acetyltransferase involved in cellulose biosynthesis
LSTRDVDLDVTVVRDLAGLRALREPWHALAARTPGATLFDGPGWHLAWWRAFGHGASLHVLAARREGELIAIAPLTLRVERIHGVPVRWLGPFRNRHTLRSDWLLGDTPGTALAAMLSRLRGDAGRWDVLLLENVPDDAPLVSELATAARGAGLDAEVWQSGRRLRFLPLAGGFDEYLRTRSSNFRWQTKKSRKRLAARGALAIERVVEGSAIEARLSDVFALESRAWQGRAAESALDFDDRAFQRALLEELAPDASGELWLLRCGDHIVAALALLGGPQRLHVFTTYYDEDFADASPGTLLQLEMLRSAWERGVAEVDFHGDTPAFARWTDHARSHRTARVWSPSLRARLLRAGRRLARRESAA